MKKTVMSSTESMGYSRFFTALDSTDSLVWLKCLTPELTKLVAIKVDNSTLILKIMLGAQSMTVNYPITGWEPAMRSLINVSVLKKRTKLLPVKINDSNKISLVMFLTKIQRRCYSITPFYFAWIGVLFLCVSTPVFDYAISNSLLGYLRTLLSCIGLAYLFGDDLTFGLCPVPVAVPSVAATGDIVSDLRVGGV